MTKEAKFRWNELETRDTESARRFYEEVLGWTARAWDPADPDRYIVFHSNGTVVAGMMDISDPQFDGIPNHWFPYVQVEDVAAVCAKVEAAGGKIRKPPFVVPKVGKVAVIADSTNAVVGLLEPESST